MSSIREIQGMSIKELEKRLVDLKTELVRARTMIKAGGAVDNTSRVRDVKRTIARILTIINHKSKEA
jgi:large subunit ribosomal protein L29